MSAVPWAPPTPGVVKVRLDALIYGDWLNLLFPTFPPGAKHVIQGSHKPEVNDPRQPRTSHERGARREGGRKCLRIDGSE